MTFVELLARQCGDALGAELMAWNDAQAQHLRQVAALGRLRAARPAPVGTDLPLHLMILIENDLLGRDRYLISHWRQDDPLEWPPARGETRIEAFDDLEFVIDDLVTAAEAAWSGHQGEVALEFVLPRALLNLPVDQWFRERRSSDPRPLALDYPIVIRSLERMISPQWHRVWRAKWRALVEDVSGARIYIADPADADQPYRVAVALKDQQVVSMMLSRAPAADAGPHDELSAALRAGLPAVLWSRQDGDPDALHEVVTHLGQRSGLKDLPQRVLVARQDALRALDQAVNPDVIRNLVIMWDNPSRLVYLDQPPRPARPEGDTADEREQAS